MNLDKNNNENKKHKGHNPLKHIGMMGACCLIPLLITGILPLLQINSVGANRLISSLSSLICPIMMGVMMIGMLRGSKGHGCCSQHEKEEITDKNNNK